MKVSRILLWLIPFFVAVLVTAFFLLESNYQSRRRAILDIEGLPYYGQDFAFDNLGRLWTLSYEDVSLWDRASWPQTKVSVPGDDLTKFVIDSRQRIWMGSLTNGIGFFDGDNLTIFDTDNSGLLGNRIQALAIDGLDRVWIGTNQGLSVYDGETWRNFNRDNSSISGDNITAITMDDEGRAWVGTDNNGINIFDAQENDTTPLYNALAGQRILAISPDRGGLIWVAFDFNDIAGVSYVPPPTINARPSISTNAPGRINTIAFDESDRLWVGTHHGFFVRKGDAWLNYTEENSGLHDNLITKILFDNIGNAWVLSGFRLFKIGPNLLAPISDESISIRSWTYSPESRWFFPFFLMLIWLGSLRNTLPGVIKSVALGMSIAIFLDNNFNVVVILGNPGALCAFGGTMASILRPAQQRVGTGPPGVSGRKLLEPWLIGSLIGFGIGLSLRTLIFFLGVQ